MSANTCLLHLVCCVVNCTFTTWVLKNYRNCHSEFCSWFSISSLIISLNVTFYKIIINISLHTPCVLNEQQWSVKYVTLHFNVQATNCSIISIISIIRKTRGVSLMTIEEKNLNKNKKRKFLSNRRRRIYIYFSVELKHWAKSVWSNAKNCIILFLFKSEKEFAV